MTGKCWPRLFEIEVLEREECAVKGEIVSVKE